MKIASNWSYTVEKSLWACFNPRRVLRSDQSEVMSRILSEGSYNQQFDGNLPGNLRCSIIWFTISFQPFALAMSLVNPSSRDLDLEVVTFPFFCLFPCLFFPCAIADCSNLVYRLSIVSNNRQRKAEVVLWCVVYVWKVKTRDDIRRDNRGLRVTSWAHTLVSVDEI